MSRSISASRVAPGGVGLPQQLLAAGQRVGKGAASPVRPPRQLLELIAGVLHGLVQGVAAGAELLALVPALVELLDGPGVFRRQWPCLPTSALCDGRQMCRGPLRRTSLLLGGLCGLRAGPFERGVGGVLCAAAPECVLEHLHGLFLWGLRTSSSAGRGAVWP